jgi:hypothetical protein
VRPVTLPIHHGLTNSKATKGVATLIPNPYYLRKGGKKMRRMVMMLGVAMLLAVVTAGAALAVTKTCASVPCEGTNQDDVLHERPGSVQDRILAFAGGDLLDANNAFKDRDELEGGRGNDKLLANDRDGRDVLRGGSGRDRCYGNAGDEFFNCEVRRP